MCHLPKFRDPNLLVGFDTSDDASVYKIDEHTALIQTVDIFPSVVDDPYEYGQIAAVNSLSDVYAMGGIPKLALNIFCFPEDLPKDVVQAILQGGYEKVQEAGALITGGHTIQDREPKYGLSVTGFAHPSEIWMNSRVQAGDVLIVTKALGTGILTTAAKADLLETETYRRLVESMTRLNRYAAEAMKPYNINSCTDVTGFGLLGHAFEMAYGSGMTIHLDHTKIPILPQALELAETGIIPAGAYRNREYLKDVVLVKEEVPLAAEDILYDPQTAGGLLTALPEAQGVKLVKELNDLGETAQIAGWAEEFHDHSMIVW